MNVKVKNEYSTNTFVYFSRPLIGKMLMVLSKSSCVPSASFGNAGMLLVNDFTDFPPGVSDSQFRPFLATNHFWLQNFMCTDRWQSNSESMITPQLKYWQDLQIKHFLSTIKPQTVILKSCSPFENQRADVSPLRVRHALSISYNLILCPGEGYFSVNEKLILVLP